MKFSTIFFVTLVSYVNFVKSANIVGRIFGGTPEEAPWQVYIKGVPKFGINDVSHCGGSLISSNAILTSANCVNGFDTFIVQFGSSKDEPISVQSVNRSNVVIYPRYNESNFNHDIAIVKLPKDIYFIDQIKPILLPRKFQAVTDYFSTSYGFISGWGATSNVNPEMTSILQSVKVRIITNEYCSTMVHKSILSSSTICTYGTDEVANSACAGDEGGPLTVTEYDLADLKPRHILIGIISFTHTKCSVSNPTGYTATAFYLDWIEQITGVAERT